MSIEQVQFAGLSVSRFIIGGNPFSTVSHQGQARDLEMRQRYTTARIKATLAETTLPLGIHYILPFTSLWDFETDWRTVEFRY